MKITEIIKLIYIYLFSAIGLILIITGMVKLIDLGLKVYIFKQADVFYTPKIYSEINQRKKLTPAEIAKREEEQRKADEINRISERQRTASNALALLIVGLPVFIYHWRIVLKHYFNKEQ
jgi:uncharacterized membrane protein